MKRIALALSLLVGVTLVMTSCGKAKETKDKTVETTEKAVEKAEEIVKDTADKVSEEVNPKVAKGKELFTAKTCSTCHAVDKKVVGPSIKEIATKYEAKNGNIVQFLKGKAEAIVDTDPAQVAVMKANIEGVLKDTKPDELQAIAAYIRSVK
jgi:cytochrome c